MARTGTTEVGSAATLRVSGSALPRRPGRLLLMSNYFGPRGSARAVLLWAVATRAQLGRWEVLSAEHLQQTLYKISLPAPAYWQGEYERHFCLIAARNLLGALDLLDPPPIVDQVLRDEITETRGLNEHWKENKPVFMVRPRPSPPPHKSGQSFAARNPRLTPYCWWAWNSKDGPLLTPSVPATAMHELIDRVQAHVLADHPDMAQYIPPPGQQLDGWIKIDGGWWPRRQPARADSGSAQLVTGSPDPV